MIIKRPHLARVRLPLIAGAVLLMIGGAGCSGAAVSPSQEPTQSTSSSASLTPVSIDITIANGNVTPNGKKLDVTIGQTIKLEVTSDTDDEIHAHTGGDGYELPVVAGETAGGEFTVDQPGSFEIESHHLNKIIAILIVR